MRRGKGWVERSRVGKREMDEMGRRLGRGKVEKVRRYVSYTYSNFTEKRKNFDKEVEIDTKYKIKRMFGKVIFKL